jgi:L-arabinose isomerase
MWFTWGTMALPICHCRRQGKTGSTAGLPWQTGKRIIHSNECKTWTGYTLLSVVEGKERYFYWLPKANQLKVQCFEIGNTNSRYKFPIGAKEFINQWSKQGPAHHCAIGVGHIAGKIEKLGRLLNLNVIKIC